jgi:hypothetical protein
MAKRQEFNLDNFLIGKLRAASRKYPNFNEAKKLAKVPVKVEYCEGDDFVTVYPLDKSMPPFKVKVHKKAQNRERVMYKCAHCGRLFFDYEFLPKKKGGVKKTSMVAIDHIEPVVPTDSDKISWDDYIDRLFCPVSNLQVLCNYPGEYNGVKSCHAIKTKAEQQERKEHKGKRKNNE